MNCDWTSLRCTGKQSGYKQAQMMCWPTVPTFCASSGAAEGQVLGTQGVLHCRPEQLLLPELSPAFQCCSKCISDDFFFFYLRAAFHELYYHLFTRSCVLWLFPLHTISQIPFFQDFILPLSNSFLRFIQTTVFLACGHMIYPNFIIYLAALPFSLKDDGFIFCGNLSWDPPWQCK